LQLGHLSLKTPRRQLQLFSYTEALPYELDVMAKANQRLLVGCGERKKEDALGKLEYYDSLKSSMRHGI
jgi:hypothetical protein